MKKSLMFLIVIFFIQLITAGSCQEEYSYYQIKSMEIENVSSVDMQTLNDTSNIPFNNYCINVYTLSELYKTVLRNNGFSLDCLHAGESDGPLPEIGNKVTKVEIISINDFDSTHPAGSDIKDYFIPYIYSSYWIGKENITDHPLYDDRSKTLESVFNNHFAFFHVNVANDDLYGLLKLNNKPRTEGFYQFVVRLIFQDGSTMADTTGNVILTE